MTKDARNTKYIKMRSSMMESQRSWQSLLKDMRRYLRNLVRRTKHADCDSFGLTYEPKRFPLGKRDQRFMDISLAVQRAVPRGWSVKAMDDMEGNGPGWLFTRISSS